MTGTRRNAIRWLRSDNLKSKIENLKLVGLVTLVIAFVICGVAVEAQQPTKIPRIGYLTGATPEGQAARIEAFRQGLRELGYVEGKNIVIEFRFAEVKLGSSPRACGRASASQGRCHRYGWSGDQPVPPRKQLIRFLLSWRRIPILLPTGLSPVWRGLAEISLDLSTLAPELSGKQLELLKEIVPKLSRVAVFGTSTDPANAQG